VPYYIPYDAFGGNGYPPEAPPPANWLYPNVGPPRAENPEELLPQPREQAGGIVPPGASAPAVNAEPQPVTVLVFHDGRTLEIQDYAIVGPTLINLGGSGPRKVALADLNVPATVKINDDHGVEFSVPR
jgi:hypothetical protein